MQGCCFSHPVCCLVLIHCRNFVYPDNRVSHRFLTSFPPRQTRLFAKRICSALTNKHTANYPVTDQRTQCVLTGLWKPCDTIRRQRDAPVGIGKPSGKHSVSLSALVRTSNPFLPDGRCRKESRQKSRFSPTSEAAFDAVERSGGSTLRLPVEAYHLWDVHIFLQCRSRWITEAGGECGGCERQTQRREAAVRVSPDPIGTVALTPPARQCQFLPATPMQSGQHILG